MSEGAAGRGTDVSAFMDPECEKPEGDSAVTLRPNRFEFVHSAEMEKGETMIRACRALASTRRAIAVALVAGTLSMSLVPHRALADCASDLRDAQTRLSSASDPRNRLDAMRKLDMAQSILGPPGQADPTNEAACDQMVRSANQNLSDFSNTGRLNRPLGESGRSSLFGR